MEVTLEEMLCAREARSFRQFQRNQQWRLPIVSFSMNIPGPVKDTPLIRRAFWEGVPQAGGTPSWGFHQISADHYGENRLRGHLCGGYGRYCLKNHYHCH